jgi:23S rRNA (uridine2552-2'-O)-methyltransferase
MPKSSPAWLREHVCDLYVKQARKQGYRARSAYKLLEIDAKDKLLAPGMTVVDLGAAPGGWSQVVAQKVGAAGKVLAVDLLPMEPLAGVEFIQGDLTLVGVQATVAQKLPQAADLVICDMAPNISGIASVDQARHYELAQAALEFSVRVLKPSGALLLKVFQGGEFNAFRARLRAAFATVVIRKPAASRERSAETYVLARNPKLGG